jgi:hypothetical protein
MPSIHTLIENQKNNLKKIEREKRRVISENDKHITPADVSDLISRYNKDDITRMADAGLIGKYTSMMVVGIALSRHDMFKDGFSISMFTETWKGLFGTVTSLWSKMKLTDTYEIDASIRSLLYEMSPSSTQHWFKYGYKHEDGLRCPIGFVNPELSVRNDNIGWVVSAQGTGRVTKESKGKWRFVENLDLDNWQECWGIKPTTQTLNNAAIGRKKGNRVSRKIEV